MASVDFEKATINDLQLFEDKAELIGGKIVQLMPTGRRPNRIGGNIFANLRAAEPAIGSGEAHTDNIAFVIDELSSARETFSPDVSYFFGPFSEPPMKFLRGAPTFAVEVRSEHDYGPSAEREMAEKRADYFEAGTSVVWDVDPEAEIIRSFRGSEEDITIFRRGELANAEPAVPGWQMAVNEVFA